MEKHLSSSDHYLQICNPEDKVGLAIQSLGKKPIHGLRHKAGVNISGWYIWCGDYSESDDFFEPIHFKHLEVYLHEILPFMSLPTGYRFLKDGNYEDVWFDNEITRV